MGEYSSIRYWEKDGELCYEYRKRFSIPTKHHYKAYRDYKSTGTVPKEIFIQGNMAIFKWIKDRINSDVEEQKKLFQAWNDFDKNPNFSVSVKHDGGLLKGRIISSEDSVLTVRLEKPEQCRGEDSVTYGICEAMSKRYMFNKDHSFTDDAINTAKNLLIEIYISFGAL